MATTTASDLIVPEVWGPVVMKKVLGKAVLASYVNRDDSLQGNPGDTLYFPKFNYIGDAEDIAETDIIEMRRLTMDSGKTTIKEIANGVALTDRAILTAMGNPQDQAVTQLATSMARKIDKDIRAALEYTHTNGGAGDDEPSTAPKVVSSVANQFDWKALTTGIALLGDEWDPADMAAIFIHSAQHVGMLNDPNFVGMDKVGADSVLLRGQVGRLGGVPVVITDRTTKVEGATDADDVYNAIVLRKDAITLAYKRQPIVEKDRDIQARETLITTNAHYAVKRTDDAGVVIIPTKVAA